MTFLLGISLINSAICRAIRLFPPIYCTGNQSLSLVFGEVVAHPASRFEWQVRGPGDRLPIMEQTVSSMVSSSAKGPHQ